MTMKLRQGQLWKQGGEYIRIVRLERLEVGYKSMTHPTSKEGTIHCASKKEFCRLLKKAQLLIPSPEPPKVQSGAPKPRTSLNLDDSQTPNTGS